MLASNFVMEILNNIESTDSDNFFCIQFLDILFVLLSFVKYNFKKC